KDADTEHGLHTLLENQHARAQADRNQQAGRTGGKAGPQGPYPAAQRKKDQQKRIRSYLAKHQEVWPDFKQGTAAAGTPGATAPGATQDLSGAKALGAKQPKEPSTKKKTDVIKGKSAEECLGKWLDKAEKAMFDKAKHSYKKDSKLIKDRTPDGKSEAQHEEDLRKEAEKAGKKTSRKARAARRNYTEDKKARCRRDQAGK